MTRSKSARTAAFLESFRPPLPLPQGYTEERLRDVVTAVRVADADEREMRNYAESDFRRFVYTLGLARDLSGDALELGANPYFTTMLLRLFSPLKLHLANFFLPGLAPEGVQAVAYRDPATQESATVEFTFKHFNSELEAFPYQDSQFDVVFFCEIIEHLTEDPLRVLAELRRVIKPGGHLIVTTPNVARLENVARLVAGANIYDPYSAYGPYGRHNREYNRHELHHLLRFAGFAPELSFTADVNENTAPVFADIDALAPLLEFRKGDLGQYLFFRARRLNEPPSTGRPSYLYRSYPASELRDWP